MGTPRKKQGLRKRRKVYQRTVSNAKLHYESAQLISIPESCRITGLGQNLTYKMVRAGQIPAVRLANGRWFVHRPKLMEWLDRLSNGNAA